MLSILSVLGYVVRHCESIAPSGLMFTLKQILWVSGALHSKHELYEAAKTMVGGLEDKYSEFLDPAGFRAAIRRPTQAELDYLSSQAVGAPCGAAMCIVYT